MKKIFGLGSLFVCASAFAMTKPPKSATSGQWICRWKGTNAYSDISHSVYPNTKAIVSCGSEYRNSEKGARATALLDCQYDPEVYEGSCKITSCKQGEDKFCD